MKKILQIVCSYYPRIGGIEQVAKDISDALEGDKNYEMKVICLNEDAEIGNMVCKRSETVHDTVEGVEVIRCGSFAKIASQLVSFTYMSELKKVMNSYAPDVVIFHYPNPFLAQFLLSYKKRKFKLAVYWHLDITKQKILGKLFHVQNLQMLNRADKVIATSPNYIDGSKHLSMFKDKTIVIPNSANLKKNAVTDNVKVRAEQIKKEYPDKIICFGLGRHVPYKGFTYLIQASKYLDDRFVILIGGKGPLSDSLKEEAAGYEKIKFLGRISDEDVVAYNMASDIFCFPSITKNEAFGIALAEGMYFGKPAVTFTIPGSGVNYVNLDGITGIECPNGDSKAYAEALIKLADNPNLRKQYGENGHKRVAENFTSVQFDENVRNMIDNL